MPITPYPAPGDEPRFCSIPDCHNPLEDEAHPEEELCLVCGIGCTWNGEYLHATKSEHPYKKAVLEEGDHTVTFHYTRPDILARQAAAGYKDNLKKLSGVPPVPSRNTKVSAPDVLQRGVDHMRERATTYDNPDGERSMAATVDAFESVTGVTMTEEQGWLFMALLKAVRCQQGNFKLDNYEDGAAYFGLAAEAAAATRA